MANPATLVSTEWLAAHLDDPGVRLIEVAGIGQEQMQLYRSGHIPGAVGWWWKDALWDPLARDFPSPAQFARLCEANGITNDTTVVFYGEGIQFGVYAWWTFTYCGHDRTAVLDGGRARWVKEGRPLSTASPRPAPAAGYRAGDRRERMRIGYREVLDGLGRPGRVILDGRSHEEFQGLRVAPPGGPDAGAVRHGRIPGARHACFEDMLNEDRTFRPAAEIDALFQSAGAAPGAEAIAYCRMSHRATVLYFALTQILRRDNVRVYDGSWTEWGNLVGVPVER